ncbi:PQQ-binding-like beta-propeller repeat protein [Streptomyces acidiscabies]|uniref:outer membrane protein assembly factor BamB family protein n=1 Tax=Streptomyces acidiscabies TaxID=42234 RepID=UPI0030CDB3DB
MTQPPQGPASDNPPNQPPAFGAPQGPPPGYPPSAPTGQPQAPAFGAPQSPSAPQNPPAPQQPPASGQPQGAPAQAPAYGAPQNPQFGAPQNSPAPQNAPAAPPQPPAGPPAAPPGYGYPQPSPQPAYGYPAPAGYGYPGQPAPAYPSPPTTPMHVEPSGDNGLKAQILIVASAVVAIALIIGGGVWYSGSKSPQNEAKKDDKPSASPVSGAGVGGTEKAPADPQGKMLFQLPLPTVAKGESADTDGSWVTDKVYAKSGISEVNGYDLDKGAKLWTVKLPGPVCGAAHWLSSDGTKSAILFKPAVPTKDKYQPCNQVGALDLANGKLLWTKTAQAGDYPLSFDAVTVSANTVAASGTSGGAAFDITTGKPLWAPKTADTCSDRGYGGGPKLVAIRKCGDYDNPTLSVQTLDPVSGKVLSEYKLAPGIEYASVVSTDPLVVGADVGDSAGDGSSLSDLFSIDGATGQLRARISVPGDDYGAECEISEADGCKGVIAGGDRLYIQTEDNSGSSTKQIVAFDVLTGKQTGQRADGGEDFDLYPLRMDGKNLIVYKSGPYDKGGQVLSVDGTTFKQTVLLKNPDDKASVDAETDMSPGFSEILFSQGRLFLSQTYVSGSDKDEQLVIAYGAGS